LLKYSVVSVQMVEVGSEVGQDEIPLTGGP
jgi:hypothetical protein